MPTVAGGLAFEYNLDGQNGRQITNLVLNAQDISGIFTGAISNWDDSSIQSLNPNVALPNEHITPYYRSDPSGENYLLSDYLLHTDPGPITTFQGVASVPSGAGQPSATWASFSNGVPPSSEFPNIQGLVGENGADAVSQGPAHTAGGIAYVETAYAKNIGLPVASVVNTAGYAVQPTSYNVATALTAAILYSDLTQNLGNVYTNPSQDAYPISAYSYFVAQCVPSQAAAQQFSCDSSGQVTMSSNEGAELAQFITFVACLGQARMSDLGYSPLPPNLVEDDFQAAGRLPGGTTPPAPTASNCDNPYITGALQVVGQPQQVGQSNPGGSDVGTGSTTATTAAASSSTTAAASSSTTAGSTKSGKGAKSSASGTAAGSSASGTAAGSSASGTSTSPTAAGSTAAGGKLAPGVTRVAVSSGPDPSYKRADGLDAAAVLALTGWSPAKVALWCGVFAAVVIGTPLGGWLWQRRRRRASPSNAADAPSG
jgi:ABC-type phosphate transport system substrate-binding protein